MSLLSRFRILTKILFVVLLLSVVAGAIAFVGINALDELNDTTKELNQNADSSVLAARMNVALVSINRAEFRMATDPRPEARKESQQEIDTALKLFGDRLKKLVELNNPATKAHAAAIQERWAKYVQNVEATTKTAETVKSFEMTDELAKLRQTVVASSAAAEHLRAALRGLNEDFEKRMRDATAAANDKYNAVTKLMIMVAAIGIALGLGVGVFIGQFGIAGPMRALVIALQRLAKGEDSDIAGADRGDEIGQTARAVNGIKDMLAEKAQREANEK
jgi:methyl-accepting chemotaxis protein